MPAGAKCKESSLCLPARRSSGTKTKVFLGIFGDYEAIYRRIRQVLLTNCTRFTDVISTRGQLLHSLQPGENERIQTISSDFLLQPPGFVAIVSIILPFHLFDKFFHLLCLSLPFLLTHFCLPAKQLIVRPAVASAHTIPQRRELTKVV